MKQVKRRNNQLFWSIASIAGTNDQGQFFFWLRRRLGAVDYDTLAAMSSETIKSADASALLAEWRKENP